MIHSGKPAIKSALTSWLGAGMRKASPLSDPVCSMPYHAVGQVSYEFTALPEDAPVEKMPTIGDVAVDVDKNGKIKRFVSIPHDDKSKLWDSKVINWLASKQQGRAHVGGQAA